mmetsp:Transcript_10862/g.35890  ORF Transcript_10862/g.35890 Transcript_10862/m.35890 type:complete len:286 (+) Transcript_10862:137-994(+)
MKIAPSAPTLTIFSPSGVNFTLVTAPLCPFPTTSFVPESYPHTVTALSAPPVTIMLPQVDTSRAFISAVSLPSSTRIALPSNESHHVTLRSVPPVTIWLSSGWYAHALKNVFAVNACCRTNLSRSQTIQLPSLLALTHSESFARSARELIHPLCSFMDATMVCDSAPMRHTRTFPSLPPEITRAPSLEPTSVVTPCGCASLISYRSLPVCGAKARIFPSAQPLIILAPSGTNATLRHSTFGTTTRKSSRASVMCHTRMFSTPQVANTSEYPTGNATSLICVAWHV